MTFLSFISIPFLYIIAECGSYADFFTLCFFFSLNVDFPALQRSLNTYLSCSHFLSGFIHITDLFFLYF